MDSFSIGDVVVLKGGSPRMTIYRISDDGAKVSCVWFNGGEVRTSDFNRLCLTTTLPKVD